MQEMLHNNIFRYFWLTEKCMSVPNASHTKLIPILTIIYYLSTFIYALAMVCIICDNNSSNYKENAKKYLYLNVIQKK